MPDAPESIPALAAPPRARDNPFTRSIPGLIGMGFLGLMALACIGSLFWTLRPPPGAPAADPTPWYNAGDARAGYLPPWWCTPDQSTRAKLNALVPAETLARIAAAHNLTPTEAADTTSGPVAAALRPHWPTSTHKLDSMMGTDMLGRSLFIRVLTGGGISLTIGLAAALLAVLIGTLYGALSAYAGGVVDGVMMRIVDILYGLPYVLLVVLLAVASDAALEEYITRAHAKSRWMHREAAIVSHERQLGSTLEDGMRLLAEDGTLRADLETQADQRFPPRRVSESRRTLFDVAILLTAIAGVSWLSMARVIRGQVLSLKSQPFMEAARALGVPWRRQFTRHLLPNLAGPIIVYATLTVPVAILQESFLSFLGIGVKPPLPSWGNLAAEGLRELNTYKSYWWLLLFPCLLLGTTLLALNFVGEGLREAIDPKRARR
jgi:ABC-type dipeptide/oligopeptide/nickel transport system permease subunit